MDDRPAWARRLTTEREARGWHKFHLIDALQAHAPRGSCTCATAPHETHAATSVRHIINRPPNHERRNRAGQPSAHYHTVSSAR